MNLAAEFAAGFNAAIDPLATPYTLTNDPHSGVIVAQGGEVMATEPGYVARNSIVIVEPVSNFTRQPSPDDREIVQILSGPFAGKWVLVSARQDNANWTLICEVSE
jgi:hypothetical protein